MVPKRTLTYVAIALILGAALALAIAMARSAPTDAHDQAAKASQAAGQAGVLGDSSDAGGLVPSDPAKDEPMLDKFVSKDPFVPLAETNATGTSSTSSTSGTTASLSAHVSVNGASYTVVQGDKVPGSSPAFQISSVTSSDVTFATVSSSLKNGDSSVSVNLGESVSVTTDDNHTYTLKVSTIGDTSSGGSSSISGHSISVLSVNSNDGTAVATLEVDSKTYSDKKVGDTFSTSAGDMKITAIDVDAQAVTVMYGDQTITLRAGQVVVK